MVWKGRMREVTLSVAVVSLLAVIPYLSTLHGYFLGDDFGLVALYSQKEWAHLVRLFWVPWTEDIYAQTLDELRPTVAFSYKLDSIFGPGSPLRYHVANVVLHVLTALLVLSTARLAAGVTWLGAAFAAALFAVLPTHAETVSWISGRADSIPAVFYLGAFLAYVAWQRVGGWLLYGLSLASFFLALYSKQSALTMIATLVAYDMLVETRTEPIQPETAVHLPAVCVANPRAPRAAPPPVRAGGPRERNHGRLAAWARYTSIPAAPNSIVRWAVASEPARRRGDSRCARRSDHHSARDVADIP